MFKLDSLEMTFCCGSRKCLIRVMAVELRCRGRIFMMLESRGAVELGQ